MDDKNFEFDQEEFNKLALGLSLQRRAETLSSLSFLLLFSTGLSAAAKLVVTFAGAQPFLWWSSINTAALVATVIVGLYCRRLLLKSHEILSSPELQKYLEKK